MATSELPVNAFRVEIDLTTLYDDDRSWCYIYIEPQKFSVINDIEKYLQSLFDIPPPVKLFVGKYLLPSSESIKILCIGDVIRVFGGDNNHRSSKNCCTRSKKRKRSHQKENCLVSLDSSTIVNGSEIPALVSSGVGDQSFDRVCGSTSDADEKYKLGLATADRLVDQAVLKDSTLSDDPVIEVTRTEVTAVKKKKHNDLFSDSAEERLVKEDSVDEYQEQMNISEEAAASDCNIEVKVESGVGQKKRKRTRHRKRKLMICSSVGEAISLIRASSDTTPPVIKKENCFGALPPHYTEGKHIRFSEGDDGNSSLAGETDCDVPNAKEDRAMVSFNRNQKGPIVRSVSNWDVKSPSAGEPLAQNFVNLLSLRNKALPLVFDRKLGNRKMSEQTSPVAQESASCSADEQKIENGVGESVTRSVLPELNTDPKKYPVITSAPMVNDVILFKTLVLTENCVPELSSYIRATVVDFCPVTYEVKLQITNNGKELYQQPLKFSSEVQTDLSRHEFTTVNWNEIHETRLVSRAT